MKIEIEYDAKLGVYVATIRRPDGRTELRTKANKITLPDFVVDAIEEAFTGA